MIWFISDNERDEKGEKIDYVIKEERPEQYSRIRDNAIERYHKHESDVKRLFMVSPK